MTPRDPKRIDKILQTLGFIWAKHPDMRFGQLLINAGIAKDDMGTWNCEDDKMLEHLNKVFKDGF